MTGILLLDWAILAVSVFNAVVLLWLGMTVMLNADRHNAGVWMIVGGLFAGTAFFVSHTAILGLGLSFSWDSSNFWWQSGWLPVILAPYAWYVVMLWYSGFWEKQREKQEQEQEQKQEPEPHSALFHRHRPWLILVTVALLILIGTMAVNSPLPTYDQILNYSIARSLKTPLALALMSIPVLMTVCIALSIDALLRPGLVRHAVSIPARQRSCPWLMAVAAVCLGISVFTGLFILRLITGINTGTLAEVTPIAIGLFDLGMAGLVALAALLLGQAIVAYEVFTGKVLPRHNLRRHWIQLVIIALGYSIVVGGALAIRLRPIYALLLTTLLMVGFYALYTWRSFAERERFMARLRPFVRSDDLSQRLLTEDDARSHAETLFHTVCQDVLGTKCAYLTPLGVLAPLIASPLIFPFDAPLIRPPTDLKPGVTPLDPAESNGYRLAISLWAERGLIGALLVGDKQDGGLYTQEEIDIAQASGERIVDMLAGEQMARRLMQLQRQRLAETRVMDLRTRRALHDDVLPALHTAILKMSATNRENEAVRDVIHTLTALHRQIADLIHNAQSTLAQPQDNLAAALRHLIDGEFVGQFDKVTLNLPPYLTIDSLTAEVVLGATREAVRNAAIHGRADQPQRPLALTITTGFDKTDGLTITISDDGIGVQTPPVGTKSGSGSGLALHSTLLAVVGGTLRIDSGEHGMTVTISLPHQKLQRAETPLTETLS